MKGKGQKGYEKMGVGERANMGKRRVKRIITVRGMAADMGAMVDGKGMERVKGNAINGDVIKRVKRKVGGSVGERARIGLLMMSPMEVPK